MRYRTRFGSPEHHEKGGVEVINADPRNYAFSNIYQVAAQAEPYEKVAVARNLKYESSVPLISISPARVAARQAIIV